MLLEEINKHRYRYSFLCLIAFSLPTLIHALLTQHPILSLISSIISSVIIGIPYIFILAMMMRLLYKSDKYVNEDPLFTTTHLQDEIEHAFVPSKKWQELYVVIFIISLILYLTFPYSIEICLYYIVFWICSSILFLILIIRFDKTYYPKIVDHFHFLQLIDGPVISIISLSSIEITALSFMNSAKNFVFLFVYFSMVIATLSILDQVWRKNIKFRHNQRNKK